MGAFATTIWSGLVIVAVVLLSRRLAGALTEPVSAPPALLAATGMTLLSLAAYLLFRESGRCRVGPAAQFAAGIVTLVPPLLVGVVLLPGRSPLATSYLVTLFLLSGVAVLMLPGATAGLSSNGRRSLFVIHRVHDLPSAGDQAVALPAGLLPPLDQKGSNVSQWMRRCVNPGGGETLEGAVTVDFAAGQKQAMIHLPFCPPFAQRPHIECQALDDSSVRLKVAAVHPYGARIEVKRAGSAEMAQRVEVGFDALAPKPVRDVA